MTTAEPELTQTQQHRRIASIDILRGLAMIVMALDHARNYFGPTPFDPLDAELTTPSWYMTRWVTYFCAPVFVFLAGTSAFMVRHRGMSREALSRRLLTRGVWLILLELTIIDASWGFLFGGMWVLQVIWAIGWSMIVLGFLIRLPLPWIGAIGIAMIGHHNLLDLIPTDSALYQNDLFAILHVQRPLNSTGTSFMGLPTVWVLYPLIPWIGVMALGYRFGSMLVKPKRDLICIVTGSFMIVSFVVLRAFSLYGDTTVWSSGEDGPRNLMTFLHTQKYPPSLQFLLMTLGPAILSMPLLERIAKAAPKLIEPVRVFGNVAMFYYILHIPLTHITSGLLSKVLYDEWVMWAFTGQFPEGYTPRLWLVYVAWIGIVLTLYFPCAWYARYKRRHRYWWMVYV